MVNKVTKRRENGNKMEYKLEVDGKTGLKSGWYTESEIISILDGPHAPEIVTEQKDNPELSVVDTDSGKYVRSIKNNKEVDNLSKLPSEKKD